MSKKKASDTVADQIAKFIGKTMGDLVNKKDSLQRQLVEVDRQIAGVRKKVLQQFGGPATARRAKRTVKSAVKAARRQLSPETRKKMAASAKKRWAKARQAVKDTTGA